MYCTDRDVQYIKRHSHYGSTVMQFKVNSLRGSNFNPITLSAPWQPNWHTLRLQYGMKVACSHRNLSCVVTSRTLKEHIFSVAPKAFLNDP